MFMNIEKKTWLRICTSIYFFIFSFDPDQPRYYTRTHTSHYFSMHSFFARQLISLNQNINRNTVISLSGHQPCCSITRTQLCKSLPCSVSRFISGKFLIFMHKTGLQTVTYLYQFKTE